MNKNIGTYTLLDSGEGRKLEQFGDYILDRPCSQAVWKKTKDNTFWAKAHAIFEREEQKSWKFYKKIPESWFIDVEGIQFKIQPTDFGHLGIFPEQKPFWKWIQERSKTEAQKRGKPLQVLNLFAYSGGSTLASAHGGSQVVHLDASKGMVSWARENAAANSLEKAPIRWIIDDVHKFLQREIRRNNRYDAIILDPPTFGRGAQGEFFKIEYHINTLLDLCKSVLSENPSFILFSCHTPGFSPIVMKHLLEQIMTDRRGSIDFGEMLLGDTTPSLLQIPSGTFARWQQ